jgi:hypothetical protein
VFEEVFSKGSEMLAFWQKLADVARIASKRKGVKKGISGYEVS